MFSKLILCASPTRLVAGYWRFGRLMACEVFDSNADGMGSFKSYLQKYFNTPVYLMVDATEEDFRIETMPHSIGTARRQMLERKLGQIYRNVKYRATQFLGREQAGRKDDRFLFMALNNSDCITPWLLSIEEQHLPVAGIYLLPVVSQLLLEKLKFKLPHLLLITQQSIGMRQTYFQDGKLCFSRTTSIDGLEESALANFIVGEAEKTRRYLLNQRLIGSDARIKPVLIGLEEWLCRLLDSELHEPEFVALGGKELTRYVDLDTVLLNRFPELPYMQVLARQVPKANLTDAAQNLPFVIYRLRTAFNLGGLAILLAGMALAGNLLSQSTDHDRLRVLAQERTAIQEALYRSALQGVPQTGYSGNELKAAVELAQKLTDSAKTPQQLMVVVSEALDRSPGIKMNRLYWSLGENSDIQDSGDRVRPEGSKPPSPPPFPESRNNRLYEIGFVEGEIGNIPDDNNPASERITRMAELLRQNKVVEEVVIVRQPVNSGVIAGLHGNALDDQAQPIPATKFKLKILLKQEMK